ncbi:uncharacterized protein DFL_009521 [Arthrobotrys flagrans]|uniref:Methyltransferase type 11 domain-containing protein n=1 Tax=Arthrobotrys flagrans TaxID=97331 RepID=A0A436ZRY1_ARTFL|nr:hypothetical protein DFL_009521 [Arthrobotrys flagrans]
MSSQTYLPTSQAYDLWSSVYDTDGNVLQQLDDIYISTALPRWNTLKLLEYGAEHVLAVDNSRGMLEKLVGKLGGEGKVEVFEVDLNAFPSGSGGGGDGEKGFKKALEGRKVDGVISTLVLEHLPLAAFFSVASSILPPTGWLLLTNMHWDMGNISSAGFLDTTTGKKVKPVSMNHSKEEILEEAGRWGFAVEGEVGETGIRDEEHARGFGRRAEKWVGVLMHVGVVFRRV